MPIFSGSELFTLDILYKALPSVGWPASYMLVSDYIRLEAMHYLVNYQLLTCCLKQYGFENFLWLVNVSIYNVFNCCLDEKVF